MAPIMAAANAASGVIEAEEQAEVQVAPAAAGSAAAAPSAVFPQNKLGDGALATDSEKDDGKSTNPLLETQAAHDKAKKLRRKMELARLAEVELLEAAQARQAAPSAMQ
jgi:hypothetical protein